MKYVFFVEERIIVVDERIKGNNNKIIRYKLKHLRSGISIIIKVDYNINEDEEERINKIKKELKAFINSDVIEIKYSCVENIKIV